MNVIFHCSEGANNNSNKPVVEVHSMKDTRSRRILSAPPSSTRIASATVASATITTKIKINDSDHFEIAPANKQHRQQTGDRDKVRRKLSDYRSFVEGEKGVAEFSSVIITHRHTIFCWREWQREIERILRVFPIQKVRCRLMLFDIQTNSNRQIIKFIKLIAFVSCPLPCTPPKPRDDSKNM